MAGRRIEIQFLGRDVSAGKTAKQVEGKFGGLQGKLQKAGDAAGKLLLGGLVAGGAAMVKFGNQASDLAETQSKVNQIFGAKGAAALDKFAAGAAKSMGQSKQTALDAASTFGIIGKGAGLAGDDLVGFSTKMTGLASDMASFSNTSPEEAIEAIGAAMRGESEPIRKYGVLLDDATLRNQAMKMGLIKTTKDALTPQQKALAAQAVILKQTADQQGDFARTSDGMANKTRIMKAQFENLTTQLGEKALPIMSKVTDWALKAIGWMEKHKTLVKTLAVVISGLVGTLWLVSKAMAAVNLVMSLNPIGIVVVAIAALVAGLIYAYKHSKKFRDIVNGAFHAVADAGKWLWEKVLKPVFRFITKAWLTVAGAIVHAAAWAFGWVPGLGPKLKAAAAKFDDFKDKVNNQLDGIKTPREIKLHLNAGNAFRDLNNWKKVWDDIKNKKVLLTVNTGNDLAKGRRATGGHVQAGGIYRVNEAGQESFQPYSSGRMVNARRTAAAGGGDFTVTAPLVLQMDSDVVWKGLLKVKRRRGGVELGIA